MVNIIADTRLAFVMVDVIADERFARISKSRLLRFSKVLLRGLRKRPCDVRVAFLLW